MFSYSFSVVHYCCCCCCVASVVSDSVRPQRRQPTRLPRSWDSPGKNTGVGCHFLLQCIKVKVKSLSRVRLFVTPWTAAHQAPLPMGFSRQEYWSGVPLPSLSSLLVYTNTTDFCAKFYSETLLNSFISSNSFGAISSSSFFFFAFSRIFSI